MQCRRVVPDRLRALEPLREGFYAWVAKALEVPEQTSQC
jgi:hypothetical protein